jgi:hypothetical protein
MSSPRGSGCRARLAILADQEDRAIHLRVHTAVLGDRQHRRAGRQSERADPGTDHFLDELDALALAPPGPRSDFQVLMGSATSEVVLKAEP